MRRERDNNIFSTLIIFRAPSAFSSKRDGDSSNSFKTDNTPTYQPTPLAVLEKNKSKETNNEICLNHSVESEVNENENHSVSSFDKEKISESCEVFETTPKPLTTFDSSSEGTAILKHFSIFYP